MKSRLPEKPKTMKEQIDQLWEACFNHIPSRLKWMDTKIAFILAFIAIVMVLVSITLTVVLVS